MNAARPPDRPVGHVVVRPVRLRVVVSLVAAVVVVVFGLIGWALTRAQGEMQFGAVDQALMTGFGLLLAGVALGFTRARVVAGPDGVRVRNLARERRLPWALVREIRFDDGAPWATLELQDDDTVTLFAVQASDGPRAAHAVLAMRDLLEQSRRPG